jgi:hypothetical protein
MGKAAASNREAKRWLERLSVMLGELARGQAPYL